MARIRNVKPAFFRDEDLIDAEIRHGLPNLMLVYAGLWTVADKRGCFVWAPRTLQLDVLPHRSYETFMGCLDALVADGFVSRYEVDGRQYAIIPTMPKHQKFHKDERPNPDIPPPESVPVRGKHPADTLPAPCQHTSYLKSVIREGDGDTPSSPSASQNPEPLAPVKALSIDLSVRACEPADLASKAVVELISDGVPIERIRSSVDEIREPIGVWAWKHAVLAGWKTSRPKAADHGPKSPSSNGAVVAKIASERARAAADLAAFEASGCATRSEYLAQKARLA